MMILGVTKRSMLLIIINADNYFVSESILILSYMIIFNKYLQYMSSKICLLIIFLVICLIIIHSFQFMITLTKDKNVINKKNCDFERDEI